MESMFSSHTVGLSKLFLNVGDRLSNFDAKYQLTQGDITYYY